MNKIGSILITFVGLAALPAYAVNSDNFPPSQPESQMAFSTSQPSVPFHSSPPPPAVPGGETVPKTPSVEDTIAFLVDVRPLTPRVSNQDMILGAHQKTGEWLKEIRNLLVQMEKRPNFKGDQSRLLRNLKNRLTRLETQLDDSEIREIQEVTPFLNQALAKALSKGYSLNEILHRMTREYIEGKILRQVAGGQFFFQDENGNVLIDFDQRYGKKVNLLEAIETVANDPSLRQKLNLFKEKEVPSDFYQSLQNFVDWDVYRALREGKVRIRLEKGRAVIVQPVLSPSPLELYTNTAFHLYYEVEISVLERLREEGLNSTNHRLAVDLLMKIRRIHWALDILSRSLPI